MRNRKTKLYPRWWARLLALVTGYYWIPCPICQKKFAGFEYGGCLRLNACIDNHVCPDCTVEAERLNKINMPRFMEEYGELYGKLDAYERALTYRNTPTILLPGELLVLAPKIYRIEREQERMKIKD